MSFPPKSVGNFPQIFGDMNDVDNQGKVWEVLLDTILESPIAIGQGNRVRQLNVFTACDLLNEMFKSSFLTL